MQFEVLYQERLLHHQKGRITTNEEQHFTIKIALLRILLSRCAKIILYFRLHLFWTMFKCCSDVNCNSCTTVFNLLRNEGTAPVSLSHLHSQQLRCFCFMFWLIRGSVGFSLDTSRASRLWRGRPSTTPCTRVRPPRATATTTAATPRFPCSAAPAPRPPQTSAATRWDTSMSTVNWQRRCVCVWEGGENAHVVCCQIPASKRALY